MAGLRQLKSKYYARLRYSKGKKRKEKLIPLHTKKKSKANKLLKQVNKLEDKFKAGIIGLNQVKISKPTELDKYFESYIEHLKVQGIKEKTITLYKLGLKTFKEIYSDQDITNLSQKDWPDFLKKMRQHHPNKTTTNIHLRSIRAFLNYLVDIEVLNRLPFKIKLLNTQKKRVKYFTDQEMDLILNHPKAQENKELYSWIKLIWSTGMRPAEVEGSQRNGNTIEVYNPLKNQKPRSINIIPDMIKHYDRVKKCSYRTDTISKKFLEIIRDLDFYKTKDGQTRSFYNLRHTAATRLLYITENIYFVSSYLGHSSVKVTEKYTSYNYSELNRSFDVSDQETRKIQKHVILNDKRKPFRSQSTKSSNNPISTNPGLYTYVL